MKITQLRALLEIDKAGSQTAAAQRLNVSQPALGLQIRDLEQKFGVKLFHRKSRGMELTPAGEEMKAHAEIVLAAVEKARITMRRHAKTTRQVLTLGTPPTPGKLLIPQLLRSFAATDGLSLNIREGLSSELAASLSAGAIDLALTYAPPKGAGFRSLELVCDTLILIGPPGRLGNGAQPVPFHKLGDYPMVMDSNRQITRRLIDALAKREGVRLSVVLDVESVNLKREVMLSENCCAIVPRGLFSDAIERGQFDWAPIVDPSIDRVLCLASRNDFHAVTFDRVHALLAPLIGTHVSGGRMNWHAVAPLPDASA